MLFLHNVKAIGGLRPKIQVNLIWKCFSIRSLRFLRNVNILLRSLEIAREFGRVWRKSAFSWIFLYKNNAQNESKSWIFSPKMAFKHVWWCFFMYPQILDHTKPQNPVIFLGFWEILGKKWSIFMKNGSRNLKIAISQKHIFAIYFCCDWAMKLKFGQVGEQNGPKIC